MGRLPLHKSLSRLNLFMIILIINLWITTIPCWIYLKYPLKILSLYFSVFLNLTFWIWRSDPEHSIHSSFILGPCGEIANSVLPPSYLFLNFDHFIWINKMLVQWYCKTWMFIYRRFSCRCRVSCSYSFTLSK